MMYEGHGPKFHPAIFSLWSPFSCISLFLPNNPITPSCNTPAVCFPPSSVRVYSLRGLHMAASLPVVKDDLLLDAELPGEDPDVPAVIPKDDRIVPGVSPALAPGDALGRAAQ